MAAVTDRERIEEFARRLGLGPRQTERLVIALSQTEPTPNAVIEPRTAVRFMRVRAPRR